MDKRYQVFVSSTYADLADERKEIIQALLELDCIPSGMELFPAANDDQWTLIKRVIDDCDYYLVVVAGRYGSLDKDGLSFTEKEYRYALEKQKPIMGFLHKNPQEISAKFTEAEPKSKEKLDAFRDLVNQKHVRFWTTPIELGSIVSRSLVQLIKSHPATGWVKADNLPSESASQEILRLRNEIEALQKKIFDSRRIAPPGTETLAQGRDKFRIQYYAKFTVGTSWRTRSGEWANCEVQWNAIFSTVGPVLLKEAKDSDLRAKVEFLVTGYAHVEIEVQRQRLQKDDEELTLSSVMISDASLETIVVQLRALGLIEKSQKSRSLKDSNTYWVLTSYGDEVMTRLRAVPRPDQ